ncbi:hypothetical protein [Archangium primigenium]|uniref:hypothetical protein n=1 Tax=[Archangium] primigenium TaxID=2792470 RepID=UPI0019570DC2|nr:hypothetical protein [Archangium primigenium]MBM7115352.1 hypothetical protein [Archangium primigenium]
MRDDAGTDLFADVLAPSRPRAQALLAPLRVLPLRVSLREDPRFLEALGVVPFTGEDFGPVRHELVADGGPDREPRPVKPGARSVGGG